MEWQREKVTLIAPVIYEQIQYAKMHLNCLRSVGGAFLSASIYLRAIVGALLSCVLLSGAHISNSFCSAE